MTRIYRYVLVHDRGIAPCPADGLITLGTCKPTIRRCAAPGDWVLGFRPGSLERGLMLWGGRVEQVIGHGEYERLHRGRPDALYREMANGGIERVDPTYHPTEAEKARDLSGPVLIFDRGVSRHFAGQPVQLPKDLMHLAAAGRGHRIKGVEDGDVARLETWFTGLSRGSGPDRIAAGRSCAPVRRRRAC